MTVASAKLNHRLALTALAAGLTLATIQACSDPAPSESADAGIDGSADTGTDARPAPQHDSAPPEDTSTADTADATHSVDAQDATVDTSWPFGDSGVQRPRDASLFDYEAPDASACNAAVLEPDQTPYTFVAGNAPSLGGGSVADGHYVLVEVRKYMGTAAPANPILTHEALTIDVTGDIWQFAYVDSAGTVHRSTWGVTSASTGSLAYITCLCGDCHYLSFHYAATPNGLTLDLFRTDIFERR